MADTQNCSIHQTSHLYFLFLTFEKVLLHAQYSSSTGSYEPINSSAMRASISIELLSGWHSILARTAKQTKLNRQCGCH